MVATTSREFLNLHGSGILDRIPLLFTTYWGDQPASLWFAQLDRCLGFPKGWFYLTYSKQKFKETWVKSKSYLPIARVSLGWWQRKWWKNIPLPKILFWPPLELEKIVCSNHLNNWMAMVWFGIIQLNVHQPTFPPNTLPQFQLLTPPENLYG